MARALTLFKFFLACRISLRLRLALHIATGRYGRCKLSMVLFQRLVPYPYTHRIIGQLTLSRFRGDTTFGWVSRILATFSGGLVGTVLWYAPSTHVVSSFINDRRCKGIFPQGMVEEIHTVLLVCSFLRRAETET